MEGLDLLEQRVGEAAAQLRSLREENDSLIRRVRELEGELGSVREGVEDWETQRTDVRERVAGLIRDLEALLAE